MFIRTVLALVLAAFAATAQAQLRPLAERAVPQQELRLKHPSGVGKVTVYLDTRTNSGPEVANVMASVAEAIKEVCPKTCSSKDEARLEKMLRARGAKVADVRID